MRVTFLSVPLLSLVLISVMAFSPEVRAITDGDIAVPPPEPIYEVDGGERPGYIHTPGYWKWNGERHAWQPGRWIKAREGYDWVPDQWQQRGDKWHFAAGRWEIDPAYEEVEEVAVNEELPPTKEKTALAKKKKVIRHKPKVDYGNPNKFPRFIRGHGYDR